MKKYFTLLLLLLSLIKLNAQSTYRVELIDSVDKTKNQIYSDTKMFIAEYWKSAQNVIQNDDKESGMILVKGINIQTREINVLAPVFPKWTYSYNVKFLMKDKKFKIIIDNIKCVSANAGTHDWPLIELCDGCEFPGFWETGIKKNDWVNLMESLKYSINNIANEYEKYILAPSQANSDW